MNREKAIALLDEFQDRIVNGKYMIDFCPVCGHDHCVGDPDEVQIQQFITLCDKIMESGP